MTAKDFACIAAIIQQIPDDDARRLTAMRFKEGLRVRFPAFDAQRFLKACGLPKGEVSFLHDVPLPPNLGG